MKGRKGLQRAVLLGCIAALMTGQTAFAKEGGSQKNYTYTVTLYAGNQGEFFKTSGVQVDNHATGSKYQISQPEQAGNRIRITGLEYGDMVMVSAQSCVSMEEESRYYVGGIRESGHDNNSKEASAFQVESDREYVIAYGIKGDMAAYVVNYQDEDGNPLAESQTFYGTVGDSPVVAFQYIENYQPQAYNLTKTLSRNEAENVFTFVYRSVLGNNDQNADVEEDTANEGENTNDAGNNGNGANNAGNDGNGANDAGNDGNGANDAGNNENAQDNENGEDGIGDDENGLVNSTDEEVPKNLVNLDDEETPLADMKKTSADARPVGNMPVFLGIAAVAVIGMAALAMAALKKRKMKNKAEKEIETEAEKKKEDNSESM